MLFDTLINYHGLKTDSFTGVCRWIGCVRHNCKLVYYLSLKYLQSVLSSFEDNHVITTASRIHPLKAHLIHPHLVIKTTCSSCNLCNMIYWQSNLCITLSLLAISLQQNCSLGYSYRIHTFPIVDQLFHCSG